MSRPAGRGHVLSHGRRRHEDRSASSSVPAGTPRTSPPARPAGRHRDEGAICAAERSRGNAQDLTPPAGVTSAPTEATVEAADPARPHCWLLGPARAAVGS